MVLQERSVKLVVVNIASYLILYKLAIAGVKAMSHSPKQRLQLINQYCMHNIACMGISALHMIIADWANCCWTKCSVVGPLCDWVWP